jgi:hypothetical protein
VDQVHIAFPIGGFDQRERSGEVTMVVPSCADHTRAAEVAFVVSSYSNHVVALDFDDRDRALLVQRVNG